MSSWRCGECQASLEGGSHGPLLDAVLEHLRNVHVRKLAGVGGGAASLTDAFEAFSFVRSDG